MCDAPPYKYPVEMMAVQDPLVFSLQVVLAKLLGVFEVIIMPHYESYSIKM